MERSITYVTMCVNGIIIKKCGVSNKKNKRLFNSRYIFDQLLLHFESKKKKKI